MKAKFLSLTLAAFMLMLLSACELDNPLQSISVDKNTAASISYDYILDEDISGGQYISENQAKQIILQEGGLESEVVIFDTTTFSDTSSPVYQIRCLSGDTHYSYSVDAVNGDILEKTQANINEVDLSSSSQADLPYIGESMAKQIALERVYGSSDQDIIMTLKNEANKFIYEGTIHYNNYKYDFRIDAMTGDVIYWSANR
ncbi:MAG: PepSY domain-containing protein [Clostridia bacterium]|nr:PepSY domain-containing protein [Clostridia bacterium]